MSINNFLLFSLCSSIFFSPYWITIFQPIHSLVVIRCQASFLFFHDIQVCNLRKWGTYTFNGHLWLSSSWEIKGLLLFFFFKGKVYNENEVCYFFLYPNVFSIITPLIHAVRRKSICVYVCICKRKIWITCKCRYKHFRNIYIYKLIYYTFVNTITYKYI